jgi:hypothetical protein
MSRREITHFGDGSFRLEGPQPDLATFIAHAERFGPAMVLETAESILPISELAQLSVAIQKIREPGKKFSTAKPVKLSKEKQLRLVQFLVDEGLPNSRIAEQLGVDTRTVSRLRKQLREDALTSPGNTARSRVARLEHDIFGLVDILPG